MDSKKAYAAIYCYFEKKINERTEFYLNDWSKDYTRDEAKETAIEELMMGLENIGLRDFGEFIANEIDGCQLHSNNEFNHLYDDQPKYVMPEIEEMGKLVSSLTIK